METFFKRSAALSLSLFSVALIGCSQTASFSLLPDSDTFQQNTDKTNSKMDILWVVDNSGSMDPLQEKLVTNFNSFISLFQANNYDFQMAVTASDAYLSSPAMTGDLAWSRFRDGTDAVGHTGIFIMLPTTPDLNNVFVTNATQGADSNGDERVFSSFRETLNNPQNAGFMRDDSFLAVIILSDEDDFSGDGRCTYCGTDHSYSAATLDPVDSYVEYLDTITESEANNRRYNVSTISVLDATCLTEHKKAAGSAIIGQRYIELADKTNGVKGSICDDFAETLASISNKIVELTTQFKLSREPNIATLKVYVNAILIPQDSVNGWSYNAANNSITFHGTAVPPAGAVISVNFDPVSIK